MIRYNFFLGGYDAEMAEIKKILDEKNEKYFDKNLQWGAKLSAYKDELKKVREDKNIIPVFIELEPDMDIKCENREKIIDHHGKRAGKDKKTSIEQIAELLDIKLDRRQQLISANDKGHIRAMEREKLPASKEEIMEIRKFDREQQGVTDEDEKLARKSINENLCRHGDNIVIINSLTNRTSAVIDAIYYDVNYASIEHFFITTPDGKFNYSGKGEAVEFLSNYFKKKKENSKIQQWYGGELPNHGYFGIEKLPDAKEKKEIVEHLNQDIISQHIFMLPFRITLKEQKTIEKNKKDGFVDIVKAFTDSGWQYYQFDPQESDANYNQYVYFHDNVRKAIFQQTGDEKSDLIKMAEDGQHEIISSIFKRKTDENSCMKISITGEDKPYTLKVVDIELRLFETGIGILSITLHNTKHDQIEDILKINDFGRRVYPQFLPIYGTKYSFLPDNIHFISNKINSEESFEFQKDEFIVKEPMVSNGYKIKMADYILQLLGKKFTDNYHFSSLIDDRMYTLCWYGSNYWSQEITKVYKESSNLETIKEDTKTDALDKWYQYLFIDGKSVMCPNSKMKEELLKKHTYLRWINEKKPAESTFFGTTRYSFMCLSDRGNFPYTVIRKHMCSVYYQIATITLAQRATLLKFSSDVSDISSKIEIFIKKEDKGSQEIKYFKEITSEVKKLHSAYIRFVNRLWFTEVTPQDQGIELYEMVIDNMQLKEQVLDLKNEIKELYEFVDLNYEKFTIKKINLLTILTAIFLPATLITGFWGMNLDFTNNFSETIKDFFKHFTSNGFSGIISLLAFSGTIIAGYAITKKLLTYIEKRENEDKTIMELIKWDLLKILIPDDLLKSPRSVGVAISTVIFIIVVLIFLLCC